MCAHSNNTVPTHPAVACKLTEGNIYSCTTGGTTTIYEFQVGKLRRFPSTTIYKSWGSPAATIVEDGACTQSIACAKGIDMPQRACKNPDDCTPGSVLLASKPDGCCLCRKTQRATKVYNSKAMAPDCASSISLPAETVVHYTGNKISSPSGCPPGDYAEVMSIPDVRTERAVVVTECWRALLW